MVVVNDVELHQEPGGTLHGPPYRAKPPPPLKYYGCGELVEYYPCSEPSPPPCRWAPAEPMVAHEPGVGVPLAGMGVLLAELAAAAGLAYRLGPRLAWMAAPPLLVAAPLAAGLSLHWARRASADLGHRPGRALVALRLLFHLALLGLAFRYGEMAHHGLKAAQRASRRPSWTSSKGPRRVEQPSAPDPELLAQRAGRDTARVALVWALAGSGPQLLLQLFLLVLRPDPLGDLTGQLQSASCLASLLAVSWALAVHERWGRCGRGDSVVVTLGWRALTAGPRAGLMALFAAEYGPWLVPGAVAHWGVMAVWEMHARTPRRASHYALCLVIGAARLLALAPRGPAVVLHLAENLALAALWLARGPTRYRVGPAAVLLGLHLAGLGLLAVYRRRKANR